MPTEAQKIFCHKRKWFFLQQELLGVFFFLRFWRLLGRLEKSQEEEKEDEKMKKKKKTKKKEEKMEKQLFKKKKKDGRNKKKENIETMKKNVKKKEKTKSERCEIFEGFHAKSLTISMIFGRTLHMCSDGCMLVTIRHGKVLCTVGPLQNRWVRHATHPFVAILAQVHCLSFVGLFRQASPIFLGYVGSRQEDLRQSVQQIADVSTRFQFLELVSPGIEWTSS